MSRQAASLEVLAPAGSAQSLEAAILCGADAVYLGAGDFNARRGAENFTADDLSEIVRRCHIRGLRVYLTMNILLLDDELPAFLRLAEQACAAGVDAAIVQDLGAARILRAHAPALRLHASTQMTIHNIEGARLLERLGFSRVVLARECSCDEIAAISAATSLEIEVFVHGALCMCMSGQCYMSSVFGQRSGNRGLCAQPCRLAFETAASENALSLKDLSLVPRIHELAEAGVTTLKIEGRMKRPEYVAAAVTACRAAIAGEAVDLDSLQSVFSRDGFTEGYFTGSRTIEMFGVRQKQDVTAAAGVLSQLENLYTDPRKQVQKVGVELAFAMKRGQPAFLSVYDCDGHSVCVEGDQPQEAKTTPTDEARAAASLGKTGGTPYRITEIRSTIDDGLMLPASAINAMRRAAFEQLDEARGKLRPIAWQGEDLAAAAPRPAHSGAPAWRVRLAKAAQLDGQMRESAELLILPADELSALLDAGADDCLARLCVGLPRIAFGDQTALRRQLETLVSRGVRHASVGNLGAIALCDGLGLILHGESFLNLTNAQAAQALGELGCADLTGSFELSLAAAKRLMSPVPLGAVVYGHLPLMTVRCCPVRLAVGCKRCQAGENTIRDRKGNLFRTGCAWGCSEIYNPVPLYLGDRMDELSGFDFLLLDFNVETAAQAAQIFADYRAGRPAKGEFTRGLFYKNIL